MKKMKIIDKISPELLDAMNKFSKELEWSRRLPVYEIHKWWARRYSGIVRLLLIFASTDNKTLNKIDNFDRFVKEIYYSPPKVEGKKLLDPFCGGGTIIIEGAKLGYDAYGIEINRLPYLIYHSLKLLPKLNFEFIENEIISISNRLDLWKTKCIKGHNATIIHTFLAWENAKEQLQIKINTLKEDKERIYYCEKCDRIYASKRKLRNCSVCGNRFDKKYEKTIHKRLRPYAIEYYCEECNKRAFKVITAEDLKKFNINFKQKLFMIPKLNETTRLIKAGLEDFSQLVTPRQLLTFQIILNHFRKEPYKTIAKLIVSDSLRSCSLLAYYSPRYKKVIPGFVIKSYWLPPQPVELNPVSFLLLASKKRVYPLGRGTVISAIRKLRKAEEFIEDQQIQSNFKIYHGPAQNILPKLNTIFDVIFTDPPYGDYQFYSDLSLFSLSVIREIDSQYLKQLLNKEIVLRDRKNLAKYENELQHVFNLATSKLSENGKMIVTFHHSDSDMLYTILNIFKNLPLNLHAIYPVVGESSGRLIKRRVYLDLAFVLGRERRKTYYTFTNYSLSKYDKKLQKTIENLVDFYEE